MTLDGLGREQIAAQLEREGIRPTGSRRASRGPEKASSSPRQNGTAPPSQRYCPCRSIAAISSTSRPIPNPTRTKSGSRMTVKTGSFSRMCMSRSLIAPCGNRFSRSEGKYASAVLTMGSAICFPVFWYVLIAAITSTSISTKATLISSISTAPTTRATGGPALLPIMSGRIFWNRCVGAIFILDVFPLPAPQVSVNTRKGAVVNYAPCQIAI